MFTRGRIAVLAGLAFGGAGFAVPAAAQPAAVLSCTNPASGATWQIHVDFAQSTVDANAARISDDTIAWHDAKDGGNYALDRKTGKLTVTVASSTGGYFIYDRCIPAKVD